MITLTDLMAMDRSALHGVLLRGHPLDPEQLAERQFLGVDLSMGRIGRALLWHTFRKTFHYDDGLDEVRGWNVQMEQLGVEGPRVPKTDRKRRPLTFGHYFVRETGDIRFPCGYRGTHFLDYGVAGNKRRDFGRFGYTPLVAVNAGSQELLLGWEVMKFGPAKLPFPLYWALQDEGPLDLTVPTPRPNRVR